MDILGIGFPELILIFIISMMVFGPRRLPELAAKAGKFVGDLRNMSRGLITEWQREVAVASRLDEIKKTQQELDQIKQDVKAARKEISNQTSASAQAMEQARQDIEESQKPPPPPPSPGPFGDVVVPPSPPADQTEASTDSEEPATATESAPVSGSTEAVDEEQS